MKKIILLSVFLSAAVSAGAYKFTGLPWEASQPVMETGGRNFLPWNAAGLEKKHGIQVHIFKFNAGTKIESERMAAAYYDTITKTPEDKILLIWVSKKKDDGIIMASNALKKIVPEEDLRMLQDEILRPFTNRWYISEQRIYAKIIGTIAYIIDKQDPDMSAAADSERYIKIDDPLYKISLKQPFYDILKLFYFEPITFCLYFPFIMYMFLVRLIGMNSGKKVFYLLNLLWLVLTGFIFFLVFNRINIIFPEYVRLFSFFMGLNLPLYMFLFIVYQDRVEAAVYSYFYNMTGGFGSDSAFEERK